MRKKHEQQPDYHPWFSFFLPFDYPPTNVNMLLPGKKPGSFPAKKHRKEKSPRIRRLTCVYYSNFLSFCKHENRKFAYYFAYNPHKK